MPVQWLHQSSQSASNFLPQGRPDDFKVVGQPHHSASVDDFYHGQTTMVAGTREALSEGPYYSYTLPGKVCCVIYAQYVCVCVYSCVFIFVCL